MAPEDYQGPGILGNFILLLISHLYEMKNFTLNLPHYFQILSRFASLGPESRAFLLRCQIVGRCMDFYFEKTSPYKQIFSDMDDLGPIKESPGDADGIGLPTVLDKKVRTYFQMI